MIARLPKQHGPLLLACFSFNANMYIHMVSKMWDEITYPVPSFNAATVEIWEWVSYFIPHFIMLGLNLNDISNSGPRKVSLTDMCKYTRS